MSSSEKAMSNDKHSCHIALVLKLQWYLLQRKRLMLHVRWDWIRTFYRELVKVLVLVGALSKAVNSQLMTGKRNRIIFVSFWKYVFITMTLYFEGYISLKKKSCPCHCTQLLLSVQAKSFAIFRSYRKQKWRNTILGRIKVDLCRVFLVGL